MIQRVTCQHPASMIAKYMALSPLDKCFHGHAQARRQLFHCLSGTALAAPGGGDGYTGHAGQLHQLITIDVPLSHSRYKGYSVDRN